MSDICPACGHPLPDTTRARLRQMRQMRGLTCKAVGQLLDPPRSHAAVSDIERGKTRLTVDLLRQFARLYATTPAALLAAEEGGER